MFVRSSIFIMITLIFLILISPTLMGTTFAAIILIMIFAFFFARKMRALQKDIQKEKAAMTTVAEESWSNVRTVKAFSNEGQEVGKFIHDNEVVFQLGKEKAYY